MIFAIGIFATLLPKYLRSEEKNKLQLSLCLVFLFVGIGRIFFIYFDYFLTGLDPNLYEAHQGIWKFATMFQLIGFGFLLLVSENKVFHGKDLYVFFIGLVVIISISMAVQDFKMTQNILNIALLFVIFIPISYIYLAIKFPGEVRKNILIFLLGIVVFAVALLLLNINVTENLSLEIIRFLYLIVALIQIIGIFIIYIGVKRIYFEQLF